MIIRRCRKCNEIVDDIDLDLYNVCRDEEEQEFEDMKKDIELYIMKKREPNYRGIFLIGISLIRL